jgi:hypothetical protein
MPTPCFSSAIAYFYLNPLQIDFFEAKSDNPMGYAQFLFQICPDGKSSGGTSALLQGICGMPIQLHAFRRAAAPPLNFHGFRF